MNRDSGARVISQIHMGGYSILSLDSPSISAAAKPGQFVMVRINSLTQPLLRRPFSIHNREDRRIELYFQVVGKGTALLSQKKEGDILDVLGPLGRGFSLDLQKEGEVALVGGGRGIAPFFFLAGELRKRGASFKVFYGGRRSEDLPLRTRFEKEGFPLVCCTDDGSYGFRGLVSESLASHYLKEKPAFVYACGPDAMMEAVASITAAWGIPSEFSLESFMGCGFGACWGCVKRIRRDGIEEWRKICEEGPVFRGEEIVWGR